MKFNEAIALYMKSRNADDGKPIGNNTRLVKVDANTLGVRLHNTIVVEIHNNGTYTLRHAGWRTNTTKDRINKYSPARLYQKGFEWYMPDGMPFFDGIKVDETGNVLNRTA